MTAPTSHFVEVTPAHTHIVVLANRHILFEAHDALAVAMNGVRLSLVSAEKSLWSWQSHRRIGWHVLTIDWGGRIQVVPVECISASLHNDFVVELRDALCAIDERLCLGRAAWQSFMPQQSLFESLIGMTSESLLQEIVQFLQKPAPSRLSEWQGDAPARLRMDQFVLRESMIVPFAYQQNQNVHQDRYIDMLTQLLLFVESFRDIRVSTLIQAIRQRLVATVPLSSGLIELIEHAVQATQLTRRPAHHGEIRQTADIALLYERWVWVMVLRSLGCTLTDVRMAIESGCDVHIDSTVMCAYQRRLLPTYNPTGWSRDGRIAIPDVMLWQSIDAQTTRVLIIDAKCSLAASAPDATALNDVTAYLRRIGAGVASPDAAVLIHPGSESHRWPSGLMVVGTNGLDTQALVSTVQAWMTHEI
jgi:hypothetical protein